MDHIALDDSDDELNCELFSEFICPASPESGTCTLEQLHRAFSVEKLENTEDISFLDGPSDSNSNPSDGVSQILAFLPSGKGHDTPQTSLTRISTEEVMSRMEGGILQSGC